MYKRNLKNQLKEIAVYGLTTAYLIGINGCSVQRTFEHTNTTNLLKTSKLFLDCRDNGYLSEKGIKRAQDIIDAGDNKQIINLYNELSEIKILYEKEGVTKTEKSERIPIKRNYKTSDLETKTAKADTSSSKPDSLLVKACEETLDEKEKVWASTADKGDSTYVLNPEKAKELGFKENGNGYFTTFVTGYTNLKSVTEKTNETEKKVEITKKPEQVKETSWYDTGIFANKWFRGAGAVLGIAGISYLISELNQPKSDKGKQDTPENKYDLPEEPADIGVGGGRTQEGSEIGGVRGGRSDDNNSETGGTRK